MTDRSFYVRGLEVAEPLTVDEDAGEVSGIIVPFNSPARIVEPNDDGDLEMYREQFLPGSLVAQSQHEAKRSTPWSWLPLYYSHTESLGNHIGVAKDVHEREEGVFATFELLPDTNIAKIKRLVSRNGYFSVKFRQLADPIVNGDLISRTAVMLQHVASVGVPSYTEAKVLSVRDGLDTPVEFETPHLDALRNDPLLADLFSETAS